MRKILGFFLAFIIIPVVAFCSTTKVLDQDTVFRPQGWTADALKFKQGSAVELNDIGEVVSGITKNYEILRPIGMGSTYSDSFGIHFGQIVFNKGSKVVFNEQGYVISGVLGSEAVIYLIPNKEPLVAFRANNTILFDTNGNLINGTLSNDTFLRPAGSNLFLSNGGILKFLSKTEVVFGPSAQVIKGTIAEELTVNGTLYPIGTSLQFSEADLPQKI